MAQYLPSLIGLLTAILGMVVAYGVTLGAATARSKRAAQIDVVAGRAVLPMATLPPREARTLPDRIRAAGWNLGSRPEATFFLLRAVCALGLAAGVLVLGFPVVLALAVGGGGWYLPQLLLESQEKSRALVIEKELPDALGDLIALLRVVNSLKVALEQTRVLLAGANPRSPLAQELQWTLEDMQTDEVGAFQAMAQRAASPALAMLAFALGTFAKSGGYYLAALEAQARGVRQTLEARGTAMAEAAEAMTAIKIIPIMLIGVTVFLMQDPYFHQFYFSIGGQILLVAVAGLMFVGYQFADSMVRNVV